MRMAGRHFSVAALLLVLIAVVGAAPRRLKVHYNAISYRYSAAKKNDCRQPLASALTIPRGGGGGYQKQKKAVVPKQGAYGKVKIHKESLGRQLIHLDEMVYVFLFLVWKHTKSFSNNKSLPAVSRQERFRGKQDDLAYCNDMLGKVSRSFSVVIRQLPGSLMVDVLVFYLVLRALDTIEDDTTAFSGNNNKRIKPNLLRNFYKQALLSATSNDSSSNNSSSSNRQQPWHLDYVGEGDEQRLLQNFPCVQRIYSALSEESQIIIADITKRMGAGMAETVEHDLSQGTTDLVQYNKYCHYVAGLVGEGLSRLFAQSGLEESYFADELYLSDQMGLFLQKTNIIRDYLEDYVEGRAFWPKSIWKKHANGSQDLGYFIIDKQTDANRTAEIQSNAMKCLNEMITDALEQVPACLAYLSELQCLQVFRFCAIPQVMAMVTLAKCYANLDVFSGVVKIRKGLSCKLMVRTNNLDGVHEVFYTMAKSIEAKAHRLRRKGFMDPSMDPLLDACDVICAITEPAHQRQRRAKLLPMLFVAAVVACQNFPYLTLVLVAAAILNFHFGPFQMQTDHNTNAAFLVIPRLWKEVMGKKR